jgi:hypothetical protein
MILAEGCAAFKIAVRGNEVERTVEEWKGEVAQKDRNG